MSDSEQVRLDKWLWAARFYKTRGLAKEMIEGGKVQYNGHKAKCSRNVEIGAEIKLRQGYEEKTIEVLGLSDTRRGAPEAQKLYVRLKIVSINEHPTPRRAKTWALHQKIDPTRRVVVNCSVSRGSGTVKTDSAAAHFFVTICASQNMPFFIEFEPKNS